MGMNRIAILTIYPISTLCPPRLVSGLAFSHPSPEADPQHGGFASPFEKDDGAAAVFEGEAEDVPRFDDRLVQNLTAIRGRDIDLTCKVYNLGNKTVSVVELSHSFMGFILFE